MSGRATIILIAKAPVAGRVKTRLCPPCTPLEAAMLAEAALRDTLEVIASTPATARVIALDGAAGPWIPDGFVIVPQLGRGLDERLANAFAAVTGPALLIGMDTPQVTPQLLTNAIDALHEPGIGAVLGLALDGGWWTIGLQNADPRVFVGVPMSTARRIWPSRWLSTSLNCCNFSSSTRGRKPFTPSCSASLANSTQKARSSRFELCPFVDPFSRQEGSCMPASSNPRLK